MKHSKQFEIIQILRINRRSFKTLQNSSLQAKHYEFSPTLCIMKQQTCLKSFPCIEWTVFNVPFEASSVSKFDSTLVIYRISPDLKRTMLFGNLSRTWKLTYWRVQNAALFLVMKRKKFEGSSSVLLWTMYFASSEVSSRKSTAESTESKPFVDLTGRSRAALSRYRFLMYMQNIMIFGIAKCWIEAW